MALRRKILWVTAAIFAVGALGGLATARQSHREPGVRLAGEVIAAASAFEHYTRKAGAISAGFENGREVASALAESAAYQPAQLEAGMIGYGAIAALQEPDFIDGVHAAARETSREQLIERLLAQPESVIEIAGVGVAASRAQAALRDRGAPLGQTGRAVKQSAYDIQRQGWSKATVLDNAGRLARVKHMAITPFRPDEGDSGRLIQAAAGSRGGNSFREGAVLTPVAVRATALAALAVLDAAGDEDVARLTPVLQERKANFCMKMAKLNLYQCLAVAGPHYEDVFCLGQHALIDTAQCVAEATGDAAKPASAPQSRRASGFQVPVANASSAISAAAR